MFLSEEIVVFYVIGQLLDIFLRVIVVNKEQYILDLPGFFKYRNTYYDNTSGLESSCVVGFSVAISYYIYLTLMSYVPHHENNVFAKIFLIFLVSTLFCTLCRYTDLYPELKESYHRRIDVITSYFADIFFAYTLATVFLIYTTFFRGLFDFAIGSFFYQRESA